MIILGESWKFVEKKAIIMSDNWNYVYIIIQILHDTTSNKREQNSMKMGPQN